MNKYHAIKTKVDGITFASKREAKRFQELKLLERAGEIYALTLQPVFELRAAPICQEDGPIPVAKYVGDFAYTDKTHHRVIEDVKSAATRTQIYLLKKKLMKANYGIEIREVL